MMNYKCSKCGAQVNKDATICPHCHAHLGGIRCQNCGFVGGVPDFVNDRCPRCSTVVQRNQVYEEYKTNPNKAWMKACIWGAVIVVGLFLLIALLSG